MPDLLPDLRLSEDVDLLVDPNTNGEGLRSHISRRLRREFPNLTWTRLGSQHEIETWSITVDDLEVNMQLAQWRYGWQAIPIATEPVRLRYPTSPTPSSSESRYPPGSPP